MHRMIKTIKHAVLFTMLLAVIPTASGQMTGEAIFDGDLLHELKIDFVDDNYWNLLNNNYQGVPPGQPVPYIMATVTIDDEVVDSIGVRFKGFTSFDGAGDKKPFKLDFNEFVKGQRIDGLRKLNLNNGTADPAMMRDFICYDLLQSMGVGAPRTSYTKVYLNDEYWGVYQMIEQVDKEFLKLNFENADGNLFKNLGWSKFEWLGPNKGAYKDIFSLKTNEEADDWTGFVNFVDFINNASDQEFAAGVSSIFNVDQFLRTLAVDIATDNWDSYLEHGRNWYMYQDTSTDIFHWIPWDYNLSLGGDLGIGPGDSTDCFIFADFVTVGNGTTTIEFLDGSFYEGSGVYQWDFGDGNTSDEKNPIHTYAEPGSYNVCMNIATAADCVSSICNLVNTEDNLNDCPSLLNNPLFPDGATPNFAVVNSWLPECCELWGEECDEVYTWLTGDGGGIGGEFTIDQSSNDGVLIRRLMEVDEFRDQYYDIFCDLLANHYTAERYGEYIDFHRTIIEDAIGEDPLYPYSTGDFLLDVGQDGIKARIMGRIDSLSAELAASQHDCPDFVADIDFRAIVINEVVASADSLGTPDGSGEYDDWLELFNNTNEAIDLTGAYLSDSKTDFQKWQFPIGTTIAANGYLIVWADKDEEQSGIHTNFKLSKDGDEIRISNTDGSVIDSVSFAMQETNVALARLPNGTGDFATQNPTHGFNNEWLTAAVEYDPEELHIQLFPNPVSESLTIVADGLGGTFSFAITNAMGQLVTTESLQGNSSKVVDVSGLGSGLYVVQVKSGNGKTQTVKFVKL